MLDRRPETEAQVVEACKVNAEEFCGALARALDRQVTVLLGEPAQIDLNALPEGYSGPGLAVSFIWEAEGALLAIPEGSGFLPGWCVEPDATGQSKLATLAQEAGMLLFPEADSPKDAKTGFVGSLTAAMAGAEVPQDARRVPLSLTSPDGKQVEAVLVWPVGKPAALFAPAPPRAKPAAEASPPPSPPPSAKPKPSAAPASARRAPAPGSPTTVTALPNYTRSLLKVRVPVVVTLAETRQTLRRVLELAPGAIIQFDKSCEEMLELAVGDRPVAQGQAVKVGDKFGIRVASMILPDERFRPISPDSR